MHAPDDTELLALWERGAALHPLDRALLLGARARPDVAPGALADLPLGALNAALGRLRTMLFGPRVEAWLDCARCEERIEVVLDVRELLPAAEENGAAQESMVDGWCFRMPTTRDLAAIAHDSDLERAAVRLLERCCLNRSAMPSGGLERLLPRADQALDQLDPCADIQLALTCPACGDQVESSFDIAAVLWDEVTARASALLRDVHRLALAYGWTEPEVLALGLHRRAAYLEFAAP